jgi:Zn-dependent protease with chaperone function
VSRLLLASLALLVFVLLAEAVSGRMFRDASARLLAVAHLVALIGYGLLPAAWLACLSTSLGWLATGASALSTDCWLGLDLGAWRLVTYCATLGMLAPLGWQGVRLVLRTRRAELTDMARVRARSRHLRGGGVVWIIPSEELVAYAGGVLRPRALVTWGLLSILSPEEQAAVMEHEGAHVRFGHPRLLLLGAVVARAYGVLPPVRRAWAGLTRELEAAADDEAVRLVGRAPLLSALARISLATALPAEASFGDAEHLRYRVRRLQRPDRPARCTSALAGLLSAVLVAAFSWSLCALGAPDPAGGGLVVCAAAVSVIGLRPVWPWRQRPAVAAWLG